jgi:hypothetical protein
MAVIGIEFTSGFAQFFFTILLVAVVVLAVWLYRRLRREEQLLVSIRRENGKLRNEIANITGWTADGRLPEDWQDKLHGGRPPAGAAVSQNAEPARDIVLVAAHHVLASIDPPRFASSDSGEDLRRTHDRIVELVDGLATGRVDPVPALANGDLDKLLCLWRRLGTYFPDEAETLAYGIAANAVLGLLRSRDILVNAPRPLTVANSKVNIFTTEDDERLRDIALIRTAAFAASSQFTALQAGEELVIDCVRPGWSGPNGHVKPRILILDRSW